MFKHVEHIYMLKLVGGFNLSEKYESVGMIIPNILYGKSKKCSKPPITCAPEKPRIFSKAQRGKEGDASHV